MSTSKRLPTRKDSRSYGDLEDQTEDMVLTDNLADVEASITTNNSNLKKMASDTIAYLESLKSKPDPKMQWKDFHLILTSLTERINGIKGHVEMTFNLSEKYVTARKQQDEKHHELESAFFACLADLNKLRVKTGLSSVTFSSYLRGVGDSLLSVGDPLRKDRSRSIASSVGSGLFYDAPEYVDSSEEESLEDYVLEEEEEEEEEDQSEEPEMTSSEPTEVVKSLPEIQIEHSAIIRRKALKALPPSMESVSLFSILKNNVSF